MSSSLPSLWAKLKNILFVDHKHSKDLSGHLRVLGRVIHLVLVWLLSLCLLDHMGMSHQDEMV